MKAITALLFFFFVSTAAMANDKVAKVEAMEKGVNMEITIADKSEVSAPVARLYRFKNSRVKKALKFATKKSGAKVA